MSKTLNQKDIKVLGLSSLGGTLEFIKICKKVK